MQDFIHRSRTHEYEIHVEHLFAMAKHGVQVRQRLGLTYSCAERCSNSCRMARAASKRPADTYASPRLRRTMGAERNVQGIRLERLLNLGQPARFVPGRTQHVQRIPGAAMSTTGIQFDGAFEFRPGLGPVPVIYRRCKTKCKNLFWTRVGSARSATARLTARATESFSAIRCSLTTRRTTRSPRRWPATLAMRLRTRPAKCSLESSAVLA